MRSKTFFHVLGLWALLAVSFFCHAVEKDDDYKLKAYGPVRPWIDESHYPLVLDPILNLDFGFRDGLKQCEFCQGPLKKALKLIEPLGKGELVFPLVLGVFILGKFRQSAMLLNYTRVALPSFVLAGALVTVGKWFFRRHRPRFSEMPMRFDGPALDLKTVNHKLSFPSGDAANAFVLAATLVGVFAWRFLPSFFAFFIAFMVCLGRMNLMAHWFSDVLMGAMIGLGVSCFFLWRQRQKLKYQERIL